MKFKVLLVLLSSSILSLAQTSVEDNFEGSGTITTWAGDDCGIDLQFTNPHQNGTNTSSTVLKYSDSGGQYANIHFDVPKNFDLSEKHTFTFKIYVPSSGLTGSQNNQVSLKLQDGKLGAPWSTQSEIIKNLVLNQWQTVSFDFKNDTYINLDENSIAPTLRTDFNRVLIQINGENNADHVLAYIDDFAWDGSLPAEEVFDNLIWSDEFDGIGAIDTSKWFHQTQLPIAGSWYNGEIQHYTNREVNTSVKDGIMTLLAKKETFTDQSITKDYTSARLNSKFAFTYGKVEVRAKLPTGVGTWPAIWMLGKNIDEDGGYYDNKGFGTTPWPACGEIDIMEHWGNNQNFVQSAMHTPSSHGATVNHGGQTISTASTAFHVYTMVWNEEKIVFSVDGFEHYTYNPAEKDANTWPFDDDMYILLNVAIQPSIEASFTESAMEIDYVRVYQKSTSSIKKNLEKKVVVYPNPINNEIHIKLKDQNRADLPIRFTDLNGVVIIEKNLIYSNQGYTLNSLDHLAKGIYILQYQVNGIWYSQKISKQ